MAFNKLINSALFGLPFELHGDGSQIRDFTYVKDVVQANLLALKSRTKPGDIFNIGGGSPVTMLHVMGIIEKITSSKRWDLVILWSLLRIAQKQLQNWDGILA
jgi:UDP-glucose 4-epimerase